MCHTVTSVFTSARQPSRHRDHVVCRYSQKRINDTGEKSELRHHWIVDIRDVLGNVGGVFTTLTHSGKHLCPQLTTCTTRLDVYTTPFIQQSLPSALIAPAPSDIHQAPLTIPRGSHVRLLSDTWLMTAVLSTGSAQRRWFRIPDLNNQDRSGMGYQVWYQV